jgi:peroxiredoxin
LKSRAGAAKLDPMKAFAKTAFVLAFLLVLCSPSFSILKPGAKLVPFSLKNVDGKDYKVTIEDARLTLIVIPFYQKLKITYPMLADPPSGITAPGVSASARDMKKKYEVQEIPVVYVIDAAGAITHAHVGFKEEHIAELDAAVKALVGERTK